MAGILKQSTHLPKYADMPAAKKDVENILQHLPDENALQDIANGRSYTHGEAKQRLNQWLKL